MALSDSKPYLSRQYVYAPYDGLSFDLSTATTSRVAFMGAGVEPTEPDWVDAIPVTTGHALYNADVGDAFAVLVGPARGDTVTTEDLSAGTYQVWTDLQVPGSDERIVEVHGTITVTAP